jgi:heptosyltransferase-2
MINTDDFDGKIAALKLFINKATFLKPTLGINAGATYGSAKRWYPEKFAEVGAAFSKTHEIIIFGGPNEVEISNEIEQNLLALGVRNYTNLAGKTSIEELCANIAACSLFVTNDSGPMHVAAAYQVPSVAIFGPTKYEETSQWMNEKSLIVRHEMECAPCMKRECPLGHHECMKSIGAQEVISALKSLNVEA